MRSRESFTFTLPPPSPSHSLLPFHLFFLQWKKRRSNSNKKTKWWISNVKFLFVGLLNKNQPEWKMFRVRRLKNCWKFVSPLPSLLLSSSSSFFFSSSSSYPSYLAFFSLVRFSWSKLFRSCHSSIEKDGKEREEEEGRRRKVFFFLTSFPRKIIGWSTAYEEG